MRLRVTAGCHLPFVLACMSILPQTAAGQASPTTLRALRDQSRPLLIFAPSPGDLQLGIQLRIVNEHAAEASDRQIVPIALPFESPATTPVRLSPEETEAARRRFHVAPGDFTVILIGKDGGAKLRSSKSIPMNKLNGTIDAMPMRQDEMHGK